MVTEYITGGRVREIKFTDVPFKGRTASGYGGSIPTGIMLKYLVPNVNVARWYRVKVMQYGNAGSAYIVVNGVINFIDTDTEYAIQREWELKQPRE